MNGFLDKRVTPVVGRSLCFASVSHHGDGIGNNMTGPQR
jgi:hypothetical protein